MGTFMEWRLNGESYCGLADYPPTWVEEAGKTEVLNGFRSQKWKVPASPEELLRAIPAIVPMSQALIPVVGHEGTYTFDPAHFDRIPVVDWSCFFEIGRQAATGEWIPDPAVKQAPAQLPPAEAMPTQVVQSMQTAWSLDANPGQQVPVNMPTPGRLQLLPPMPPPPPGTGAFPLVPPPPPRTPPGTPPRLVSMPTFQHAIPNPWREMA